MLKAGDFFELKDNPFLNIFNGTEYVWESLKKIRWFINENIVPNVGKIRKDSFVLEKTVVLCEGKVFGRGFTITNGDASKEKLLVEMDGDILPDASIIYAGVALMDNDISIGKGTVIEPGALIKGPTIIDDNTEVRQGAYIRGDVLVGTRCVVGHTTEIKHSILLGGSKAGHFAYIGDSILGRVNLGAGTKLANLKLDESDVILNVNKVKYETGINKFGAVIGDGVEIGCNVVSNPGTLLGKCSKVYPNSTLHGYYPPKSIIKRI